jgi:hypothetical protein
MTASVTLILKLSFRSTGLEFERFSKASTPSSVPLRALPLAPLRRPRFLTRTVSLRLCLAPAAACCPAGAASREQLRPSVASRTQYSIAIKCRIQEADERSLRIWPRGIVAAILKHIPYLLPVVTASPQHFLHLPSSTAPARPSLLAAAGPPLCGRPPARFFGCL